MVRIIAGSTKCRFPHPTDHFKLAFDGNISNSNFLFVSVCSTRAVVLSKRDGRRAANLQPKIGSKLTFELEQSICKSHLTPLWWCLGGRCLGNHQSWSLLYPWLHLSATFPQVPFFTPHTRFLSSRSLITFLASCPPTQPLSTPALLPYHFLAFSSLQHTSVQCKSNGYMLSQVTGTTSP